VIPILTQNKDAVSLDSDTPDQDDVPEARAIHEPLTEASFPEPSEESTAEADAAHSSDIPANSSDAVTRAVEDLARQVERLNDRAVNREAVIDALHSEVESLRRGERKALLRPILTANSRLRDGLLTQSESLPDGIDATQAAQLLVSFADEVEMLLSDNGVAVETPAIGSPFDPRRQRVMATIPTADEAAQGTIAHVGRSGYVELESDTLLARAGVSVYRFAAPSPPADSPGASEITDEFPKAPTFETTGEQ
jgi:molecular chaperone GrpE